MRLAELLRVTPEAVLLGSEAVEISALVCDSRRVTHGTLFAALSGTKTDGADFVTQAIANGAAAIMVTRKIPDLTVPQIITAQPRLTLARLANHFYGNPSGKLKLIGITGTNGKTTVAFLLRHLLRTLGHPTGLLGTITYDTINAEIPAPLTTPQSTEVAKYLAAMGAAGGEYAVLEASSHALIQDRLAAQTFAAAVFTNLSRDHLDYHANMQEYAAAKKKLFSLLPATAIACLNHDSPISPDFAAATAATVHTYGFSEAAKIRAAIVRQTINGTHLDLTEAGITTPCQSPLVGRFNVENVLAAWTVLRAFGFARDDIARAIQTFPGVPGRLERVQHNGKTVFVDYAHTDAALRSALTELRALTTQKLHVVFGCGGDRDSGKRPLMGQAAEELADKVYVTNDNPRTEDAAAIVTDILAGLKQPTRANVILDRQTAIEQAIANAAAGEVILVAGKGHEDYQLIGEKRLHLDDRELVRAALGMPCPSSS